MGPNLTASNLTCDPSLTDYLYFGALLGTAVSAVGTVGNAMTVLAFTVDRKLRTKFNLLILNLTLADLLYCAFLQPITIDTYVHLGWRQGDTMCRVFGLLLFVANLVSIFNLATIALSRYVLVSDPRRFDRVYSRYAMPFFLAGPWLVAVGLLTPFWSVFEFQPIVCTCSFHRTRGRPYTTVFHVVSFGLGLSCIGLFYLLIHRKIKAASRALEGYGMRRRGAARSAGGDADAAASRSEAGREPSGCSAGRESRETSGEGGRRPRRTRRGGDAESKRVTAMCFAMFLVYLACYLPFCLVHMLGRRVSIPPVAQTIAGNLTWFNSCLNPILYAAMNRQFKDAYRAVLRSAEGPFRRSGCRT